MSYNTVSLVSWLIWERFRWKFIDIFEDVCSLHTCFSADSLYLLCCIMPCEGSRRFFRATRYINNQILQLEQLHNTISTCRPKISWKNTSSVNSRRSVFMPHTVAKYQSQGTCRSKITINVNGRTRWSLYGVLAGVSAKSLVHSIRTRSHSKPHSVIIHFCSRRRNKYAYRLYL